MVQTSTLKIAIIEDEPFSRLALKEILTKFPYHHKEPQRQVIYSELSLDVVGCASNASELLELLKNNDDIEMLLLDYSLNALDAEVDQSLSQDGAALIKRLLQLRPELKIIVHTAHKSLAVARIAWQAGAWGFVQKNSDIQELFFAISYIYRGKKFFPIELAAMSQPAEPENRHSLTERETEVLRMLLNGVNQKEISILLNISFKTVSNTKTRAFKKLGFTSNADFFKYAHEILL
ncbi:response regulator [Yersinia enterocolitica]|jgi:two-component system response regulator FimZ (fimbrial Z protein)|uniref:Response regulator protein n=2 Tax=Yersinia TaxID=629 RepID=A0AAI8ZQW5_YERFR|nr:MULTISPECIES: response regulator transcription factor [Yersinia]ATM88335.1 DNA-binding response regulator [Yersinia frederiksenii]AVX39895.1 DNA-binding response regulator [Yersinia massiliensis]MCB5317008.1 response regulator transcription factor [Yersinia massiliensis]MDN0126133.1 response regulator transcription factor [Yersinia massiliensis]QKJ10624.1 response regulator transcription factor [Yersinia massiliensis]